jgi:hypothetical protein
MAKRKTAAQATELVTLTVRLRPSIVKRTKLAATLLELPVQTVVSLALDSWLIEHERQDQATLLHRFAALRKDTK